MNKHTPGPWTAEGTDVVAMVDQYPSVIADCLNHRTAGRFDATNNARLIASAPDLLEALTLCEGNISSLAAAHPAIYTHWLTVVRAAIDKAQGGCHES